MPAEPLPPSSKRRLLCRLGLHTAERSQGLVGYCLRDGCDDLKRVHNGGAVWTRYVTPPKGDPPHGAAMTPAGRDNSGGDVTEAYLALCEACGEPVSVTDPGGCVGAGPHWHFKAECLLEAARRADAQLAGAVEENERLRAFAFGDAPEWEKANATLKHRVRELEAEVAELRGR